MPKYSYVAVEEKSGREVKGVIDAASQSAAAADLRKQGLFATKIKEGAGKKKKGGGLNINLDFQFGPSVIKRKQLLVITRQLATLLEAGLPLIRSLRTLQRQCKDKMAQKVLAGVADSVETGSTFSEALSLYPQTFDKLFLNMVRAGEAAGAMENILGRLAGFMEKTARLAGKVKSAMIYPSVVITMALGVTTGLMIFIVPSFTKIFTELLHQDLHDLYQRGDHNNKYKSFGKGKIHSFKHTFRKRLCKHKMIKTGGHKGGNGHNKGNGTSHTQCCFQFSGNTEEGASPQNTG